MGWQYQYHYRKYFRHYDYEFFKAESTTKLSLTQHSELTLKLNHLRRLKACWSVHRIKTCHGSTFYITSWQLTRYGLLNYDATLLVSLLSYTGLAKPHVKKLFFFRANVLRATSTLFNGRGTLFIKLNHSFVPVVSNYRDFCIIYTDGYTLDFGMSSSVVLNDDKLIVSSYHRSSQYYPLTSMLSN